MIRSLATVTAVLLATTVLSACGGMLPGTIYSSDGKVMPFEIELASRTGSVRASDPSTGEQFVGKYVGIVDRINVNSSSTIVTGSVVASGFGRGSITSNTANATAYLKGDKGTMLNCEMKIEGAPMAATLVGVSPHGIGGCDDNYGGKYKLQF